MIILQRLLTPPTVSWRELENEFEQMTPHNGQVLIQFPNRGKALLETPGEGMQNKTRWGGSVGERSERAT